MHDEKFAHPWVQMHMKFTSSQIVCVPHVPVYGNNRAGETSQAYFGAITFHQ